MSKISNDSSIYRKSQSNLASESGSEIIIPESVNYHITERCNYHCHFCFAKYTKSAIPLSFKQSMKLINLLREKGCSKINFAGGEPTLIKHLPELVNYASRLGFFVSLISNGTGISRKFLESCGNSIDLLGLSVDSQYDVIEIQLGRTIKKLSALTPTPVPTLNLTPLPYSHVNMIKRKAKAISSFGIPLKINTTVTALNYQEDMNEFIEELNPLRWKVFQVHRVNYTNDFFFQNRGGITADQFSEFIGRHRGHNPIFESSQIMQNSYFMITPDGRIYSNSENGYEYTQPIVDNESELSVLTTNFNKDSFIKRNGMYYRQTKRKTLPY